MQASITLSQLWVGLPDLRKARGKRHAQAAMLNLICFGLLCGHQSYGAIADWGRNLTRKQLRQLGFTHRQSPCATTLQTLLSTIDIQQLIVRFADWVQLYSQVEGIAIDGKTLRGSRKQGVEDAHILTAVSHGLGCILAQLSVSDKTNEIPVTSKLLKLLDLEGRVVTMDALLTQSKLAKQIVAARGHYLMVVKGNQDSLRDDIQSLIGLESNFGDSLELFSDCEKSHARITIRSLSLITVPPDLRHWPGSNQAFVIKRECLRKGKWSQEVIYGITSLPREEANAERVSKLLRQHWTIENRQHWVKDVTYDEDRSQVRLPKVAHAMAWFRSAAISILRCAGFKSIVGAFRFFQAKPNQAIRLITSQHMTFG